MNRARPAAILGLCAAMLAANVRLAPMRRALRGSVERVGREDLALGVRCSGELEAKNVVVLRSEAGGKILRKYVKEADPVKKGQLLLEFDPAVVQEDLDVQLASQNTALREFSRAQNDLPVEQQLFNYGVVPKKNVEDAEATVERTRSALGEARHKADEKRRILAQTKVFSPVNGYLIKEWDKKGESIAAGKEIFTVGTLDVFWATLSVDEMDISRVAVGQGVELKLEAFPDTVLPGRVTAVSPEAERTGFAKIEVDADLLDTKGLSLKPNLSVQARIITGRLKNCLTIPTRAVARRKGRPYVWVIGALGRISERDVLLGQGNEDRMAVSSGLREGEVVLLP